MSCGGRDAAVARSRHLLPLFALAVAVLGIATYAWDGIVARLAQDPLDDLRWQYVHYGMDALRAWLPLGSGFGSFRFVYAPFEPIGAMTYVYALHAHNDLLELLIEGGVAAGVLCLALFALLGAQVKSFTIHQRAVVQGRQVEGAEAHPVGHGAAQPQHGDVGQAQAPAEQRGVFAGVIRRVAVVALQRG